MSDTILVTGADGFTGRHLSLHAAQRGFKVVALSSDLTDASALADEVSTLEFEFVIHLAAISAVTHEDQQAFYAVNVLGSMNLLDAIKQTGRPVKRVILASSANIYGNSPNSPLAETERPAPVNHYAMSKLAMEYMARAHSGSLPITLVRPFNYTGKWHDTRFVIPKLVDHFSRKAPVVELGDINVEREFNDIQTVCEIYLDLLEKGADGETYNICSGTTYSLNEVIQTLTTVTGHTIDVQVNPAFVRANEIPRLCGDPSKLGSCLGPISHPALKETLLRMLAAAKP